MSWTRSIMDVYWDMRPCYETQELYKRHNLKTFDYWKMELEYLTGSTWVPDEEFRSLPGISYLLEKYHGSPKIRLDKEDRRNLGCEFITDLGMNPYTFALMHLL